MSRRRGPLAAAITWGQVAMAVREHWLSVPRARRERLAELLMRSRLRPSRLSPAQRAELRELVAGMRLVDLGRRLATIAFAKRGGPTRRGR